MFQNINNFRKSTKSYDTTVISEEIAFPFQFQFQVNLGKRIGFYKLGKELGAGNFSKVKLGFHVLTKGK